MKTVTVLYFSGMGHTTKMAEAVAKGAGSLSDINVNLIGIEGKDIENGRYRNETVMEMIDGSDAVIFGSPTYMGGPAAQFKAFADASGKRWMKGTWKDKLAAGFTVSGSPSGDKLSTLHYFFSLSMQHMMVWVGLAESAYNDTGINRLGSYSGAMAQAGQEPPDEAPSEPDKLTGESLGRRVAEWALKLK